MDQPSRQRGFTIVELMIAVAVIAILAAIVVPSFTRESRKAKGSSEVNAMFAELSVKLEQYKVEHGSFLAADKCPSAPAPAGYNFVTTCKTSGSAWDSLRVNPPESTQRCAYTIVVGTSADTLSVPTGFKTSQGGTGDEPALASSWWYLLAECDQNGQGGTNATYYQSSVDATIQKQNEGS